MNQNLSRQKLVLGGVAAAALVVVGVIFVSQGRQVSAPTPEAVVEAIYTHCQAGEHAKTAAFYESGPADDAALRISVCEKITQARTVKGHETYIKGADAKLVVLQTRNRLEAEFGRTLTWTLVLKRGRWLVREVV